MTVPGQAGCEEDDDDDMPPLEPMSQPAPKTEPVAAAADDDDDDMPPLDYVGLTPGKKEPEKKVEAVATPGGADDDDDMPPLEYVGIEASHAYSFREGSKVRLKGLTKADLNGQTGTILPFLNTTKDRLPVRLDSTGKSISIKPENLESVVAAGPELTPEPKTADEDSDDSMPPLEEDSPPPPSQSASGKPAASPMPSAPKPAPEEDGDDDMPPLEFVGTASPSAQAASAKPAPAPKVDDDDDDDMPPLEFVGTSPTQAFCFKEGDKVALKGLSKAEMNGLKGTLLAFTGSKDRLPVKLDSTGKSVSIKPENLERLSEAPQEQKSASPPVDDDDDDMPPLDYVGTSAPAADKAPAATPGQTVEEDDDEMPPLEFVGVAAPPSKQQAAAPKPTTAAKPAADDDDDDMPPLEYVGASAPSKETSKPQEDDDDDMPPLEFVGTAKPQESGTKPAPAPEEDDDDMPPLEYVGTSPSAGISFKEGDKVVLKGLSKGDLNGQTGTIMTFTGASKDRLPVRLDKNQQRISVKPENLDLRPAVAKPQEPTPAPAQDDDDDDLPPLETDGVPPQRQAQRGKVAEKKPVKPAAPDSDSDDMPPLEYVGAATPECTGPSSRPSAAAPENTTVDDDDDDMPPLEYVGAAAPGASKQPSKAEEEDDDDMPPLEYVGTSASAPATAPAVSFKEGDAVILKGLSKADLNGQRGTIMAFSGAGQGGRLPVKLQSSGQKVSIKPENLEQAPAAAAAAAEDSEDDMPPLEYVGAAPERTQPPPQEDDDDDMPPLEYVGAAPPAQAAAVDDDDDMPPLEPMTHSGTQPAGPLGGSSFRENDFVALKGLSKAELNGQRGTVLPFTQSANGRLPVRLASNGEKVSIKPENLEKVSQAAAAPAPADNGDDDDDDDDDMPPLEYVGSSQQAAAAAGNAGAPADDGAASDDSMPPLDYVGTATPVAAPAPAPQEAARPAARQAPPARQAAPARQAPPPHLVPPPTSAQGASPGTLRGGDIVTLSGLRTGELNGERAKIVRADPSDSRVQCKLLRTGKKLLVKWANVQKAAPVDSDGDEGSKGSAAAKTPEELLEQMRQAMQALTPEPVVEALAQVDAAQGLDWGELLNRKKQIVKKLRAKRRKLLPDEDTPPVPETPERAAAPAAATKSKAAARQTDKASSSHSEQEWVVLSGTPSPSVAAAPSRGLIRTPSGPKAAPPPLPAGAGAGAADAAGQRPGACSIRQWCEELQLPTELIAALEAEEVSDPQELTGVADEELAALTKGWKIGPKGRFMKAIRRMKALEQAELGSTCGSIA